MVSGIYDVFIPVNIVRHRLRLLDKFYYRLINRFIQYKNVVFACISNMYG